MSMLAERKRKQKWSLNPRGKAWAQDSNKFGQKLLEKMGWSQGKGLGAKEDGRTEHIKVSYKNDSQGMGYKESEDQWTEHEANFTALLAALGGGENNTEIKLCSLEEKSQHSRARVHYRKFTRGKDLSKYSEKDLANIFGKKSLNDLNKAKKEIEGTSGDATESTDKNDDKNFSNAGLMSDYFKKKLPSFGQINGFLVGNNGVLKKYNDSELDDDQRASFGFGYDDVRNGISKEHESESETEMRPSFGFGYKQEEKSSVHTLDSDRKSLKSSFVSYIHENTINEEVFPKKKKDKKKRTLEDDTSIEGTPCKKKKLEIKDWSEEKSTKKTKDKKKNLIEDTGVSNPAFDPLYVPAILEKHILEPIEESIDESCNDTLNDTVGQVAEDFEVQVQIVNEVSPKRKSEMLEDSSPGKKKKKKGKTNGMEVSGYQDEDICQNLNINEINIETSEEPKKKKKRLKKLENSVEEMETSSLSGTQEISLTHNRSDEVTKKEKKRKKLRADMDETVGTIITSDINEQYNNTKKKKSKSKEGIENPFFNVSLENDSLVSEIENPYELKSKKLKKKDHKSKENSGIENPVFNQEDSINSQECMNEGFEVKRKDKSKKKKTKDQERNEGLDNPALNLNDIIDDTSDLMLNIVSLPVQTSQEKSVSEKTISIKKVKGTVRRKSVRFSDVTRERIIPTKEEIENETLDDSRDIVEIQGKLNDSSDLSYIDKFIQKKKSKKKNKGVDNVAFDQQATSIEENITSMSKTLDTFQAEIENDMNEAKLMKSVEIDDIMVGEVGNPDGDNEKLPDGTVKLKFRHASFKNVAKYIETLTGAKKSYKHLIKGDIVMKFKDTNLHEIDGYAVAKVR